MIKCFFVFLCIVLWFYSCTQATEQAHFSTDLKKWWWGEEEETSHSSSSSKTKRKKRSRRSKFSSSKDYYPSASGGGSSSPSEDSSSEDEETVTSNRFQDGLRFTTYTQDHCPSNTAYSFQAEEELRDLKLSEIEFAVDNTDPSNPIYTFDKTASTGSDDPGQNLIKKIQFARHAASQWNVTLWFDESLVSALSRGDHADHNWYIFIKQKNGIRLNINELRNIRFTPNVVVEDGLYKYDIRSSKGFSDGGPFKVYFTMGSSETCTFVVGT